MHLSASTVTGTLDDIVERAGRVPPIVDFPTVDALLADFERLAAADPDHMRRRRLGTSRLGEPIDVYELGAGPRSVVLIGGVHPNEPIGFRTLQHLARTLLADPGFTAAMDATWHLVPCIDPDGTRLNESWFADPSDRRGYFRGFYRPAPDEQVEWSFPFEHGAAFFDRVPPETRALMRLIDRVQPELFVGLHNSELGGVYYYLSRAVPGAVEALHRIPAALDLPLDVGEPESAEIAVIAPAVYLAPRARERYDHLVRLGVDPVAATGGAGSADYLDRSGGVTFVAELPYWTHPDATDARPGPVPYRTVVATKAAAIGELGDVLTDVLSRAEGDLVRSTPFLRAARAFAAGMGAAAQEEAERARVMRGDRLASVAETFSAAEIVRSFRLRFGGILLRALDAEVVAGTAPATLRRLRGELAERIDAWYDDAASVAGIEPLPIELLVGTQLGSTLAMVALLRDQTAEPR